MQYFPRQVNYQKPLFIDPVSFRTNNYQRPVPKPPKVESTADRKSRWTPRIDIIENASSWILVAEVPGVRKQDIMLNVDVDRLILSGRKELSSEGNLIKQELIEGNFERVITLPLTCDSSKIEATLKNGALEVILPKQQRGTRYSVKIRDQVEEKSQEKEILSEETQQIPPVEPPVEQQSVSKKRRPAVSSGKQRKTEESTGLRRGFLLKGKSSEKGTELKRGFLLSSDKRRVKPKEGLAFKKGFLLAKKEEQPINETPQPTNESPVEKTAEAVPQPTNEAVVEQIPENVATTEIDHEEDQRTEVDENDQTNIPGRVESSEIEAEAVTPAKELPPAEIDVKNDNLLVELVG